jgi:hypothetical protein
MRQFTGLKPIRRLSLEARVLYTGFLVFLVLGLGSSVLLYRDSFDGLSSERAARYYLGEAVTPASVGAASPRGPVLELPAGPTAGDAALRLSKPPRQMLETFHFHLFTVPVVLLIVGHMFMLTGLSARLKTAVLALAAVTTLLHLLAPLAVRFLGAGLAPLLSLSALASAAAWLPMTVLPVWEMWRPVRPDEEQSVSGKP